MRVETPFTPVTITLESRQELDTFISLLTCADRANTGASQEPIEPVKRRRAMIDDIRGAIRGNR